MSQVTTYPEDTQKKPPDELTRLMSEKVNLGTWKEDWNSWVQKYIASGMNTKEFDLVL